MLNKRLLKSLLLYLPVKLIPAVNGFAVVTYLYGRLNEGEYVYYSISVAVALLSAQIGGGWVGNAMVYYISTRGKKASLLINSYLTMVSASVLAAILVALGVGLYFEEYYIGVVVFILCLFQGMFYFFSAALQAVYNVTGQLCAVLIQASCQLLPLIILFHIAGAHFEFAVLAIALGFLAGTLAMLPFITAEFNLSLRLLNLKKFNSDFKDLLNYGGPMAIWTVATLFMFTIDRFVVGAYQLPNGDSYLSMKDLLLGASSLISMPLLMLLHPLIFSLFKERGFPSALIEQTIAILILAFSLFWTFWQIVGIPAFQYFSGRTVTTPTIIIFLILVTNLSACIAIYLQKRLEAHKRTITLAKLACVAALASLVLSFVLGAIFELYGVVAANVLSQLLYCWLLTRSTRKRLNIPKIIFSPILKGMSYWVIGILGWYVLSQILINLSQAWILTAWLVIYLALSIFIIKAPVFKLMDY